jgi:hypothetical protein
MYDLYETVYGIFNHLHPSAKNRPLASVAMFSSEDINDAGLLELVIRRYVDKDIHSIFGLNLEEFLNLPMDIAEMLMEIATTNKEVKKQTLDDIERNLNSIR